MPAPAVLPIPFGPVTLRRATRGDVPASSPCEAVGTMQLSVLPGLARRGALRAQLEAVHVRPDRRGSPK